MPKSNEPNDDSDRSHRSDYDSPTDEEVTALTNHEIDALRDERAAMSESFEDMGRRLIQEALPTAIASVTKIAEHGATESSRLKAAQYIIDRNLGPVIANTNDPAKNRYGALLDEVTTTIPGVPVPTTTSFN